MNVPRFFFKVLPIVLVAAPVWSAPLLSPPEALKKMEVPEGFQVDLLAAEPDLVQPIAFCWDARGRIWVVEGNTYPTRAIKPPERADGDGDLSKPNAAQKADIFAGKDRILIFEDGDGDGSFETRKVFIEGLNLVSGIEMGFGGVYVGAAPYLLHIPIDEKTDRPSGDPVILTDGWGFQDTHETLNSFIWGPDGWLYGCHGVFTHSEVRVCTPLDVEDKPSSPAGARRAAKTPLNCAYWRFHPVKHTFEIFAHGTSNSWGFDYNENGDWFSEACVIPHFWHIIQGGYYLRQSNPLGHFNPYVYTNLDTIADHQHFVGTTPHSGNGVSDEAGGGHAHCGLLIYNGDNFPAEYRGRAMMFNIHGQRINQENLVPEGSGYVAKHLPDFLKTHDPNFTGVALKVGPDGAVYFIDWYDQQKCHRPQPEIWDRSNGRLYRVKYASTWKPWKGDVRSTLNSAKTLDDTRSTLFAANGWLSRMAIKSLVENPQTALNRIGLKGLGKLATSKEAFGDPPSIFGEPLSEETKAIPLAPQSGINWHLWIGYDSEKWFAHVLGNADATVAARAVGPLMKAQQERPGTRDLLITTAKTHPSPKVRLALASALQRLPLDQRWDVVEALIQHAEDATDHNLPQMYWYAIEPCVPTNPEKALELAAGSKIPLVAQHIARRVADMGSDEALASLLKAMAKEKTGAGIGYLAKAALDGLRGRSGLTAPKEWEGAYANFDDVIARRPEPEERVGEWLDLRTALAVAFGDQRVFPQLRAQVADTALAVERRQAALQTLVSGRDAALGGLLLQLLDDPSMRLSAIRSVGFQPTSQETKATTSRPDGDVSAIQGDTTASALLSRYATFSSEEKSAAINALATRAAWASALLEAVKDGAINRAEVASFVARQIADFKDEALTAKLEAAWGKVGGAALGPEMAKMADEEQAKWKKALTPDFLKGANRSAGRVLYATSCGQCHVLFGEGGKIGPDLTGSNRANLDYILENVTNPNALIGADYELHVLALKDGRSVAGMIRKATDSALTVQTITAEEVVAKADIAEQSKPGLSMMPMGLFTALTEEQVRDLIGYLASPTQVLLPGEGPADTVMRVPGALEGEALKIIAKSGGEAMPQNMASYPDSRWSGDEHLWWTGAKPGDRLTVALPVTQPGKYALKAVFSRAPDYGVARFHLDGKPLSTKQIDFFGWKVTATPVLTLGDAELTTGEHQFTLEITGANPEAVKAFMIGLDYLWLEKL